MKLKIKSLLFISLIQNQIYTEDRHNFITEFFEDIFSQINHSLKEAFNNSNPYKNLIGFVQQDKNPTFEEKIIVDKRLRKNKECLEKIFQKKISKEIKIAICSSGGGYRAMIYTLGILTAMQESGLLDSVTYFSSLSGSTWALAPWISSGKTLQEFIKQVSKNLAENEECILLNKGIPLNNDRIFELAKDIAKNLVIKYLFDQPLTASDVWGGLIAENVFYPILDRQKIKLSHQQEKINTGNYPFPIYTAVEPMAKFTYDWYEFNPYEVRNLNTNYYVSIWSFGRKFKEGRSLENAPEFPISFFLGLFGSGFSITQEELMKKLQLKEAIENLIIKEMKIRNNLLAKDMSEKIIQKVLHNDNEKRLMKTDIKNFCYQFSNGLNKEQEEIILMDAGIDFNIPLPPLLKKERKIDLIFILDASANIKDTVELRVAEQYAKIHNLKMPKIDYTDLDKKSLSIFNSKKEGEPIIIYMPLIKDKNLPEINDNLILKNFDPEDCLEKGFCNTYNFRYTQEQFSKIFDLGRFNFIKNVEKIKEVIKTIL